MRIAIDMDDTLSHFVEEWIRRYCEKFNDNLDYSKITEWDIEKFVKCSRDEIYAILDEEDFFLHPEPVAFAENVISKFKEAGHEVFVVTATYNPRVCSDKYEWLNYWFGFEMKDIVFCIDKSRIDADILIDDGAHNISAFKGETILFDRPHNWFMQDYEYGIRAKSWKEIETYFKMRKWL